MIPHSKDRPVLPTLAELGYDLLLVSPFEVVVSILRPATCFALFWSFGLHQHYLLAAAAVAGLMFFTYTSTSHDLVHRTLRLPLAINEVLLFLLEAICLRSGHAFRLTHLHHHRRFPHDDDIEAGDAAKGWLPALLCGPLHQWRLFTWAWQRGNRIERGWMLAEAACILIVVAAATLLIQRFPLLAGYVLLVTAASWLFPLATVWWPHRPQGATALQHTRGFRGRIIPTLFFQHTYHLEHHLYPGVSSHRWADLGERLEPHLLRCGVQFVQLP